MWQYVVQNWLRERAQSALNEALSTAASDASSEASAGEKEPPPPVDLAMICALGIEAGGVVDRLSGVLTTRGHGFTLRQGGWRGRNLIVVESGVGRAAARQACETILAAHCPPWVLSIGFAGGLQPQVARGDIVIADRIVAPGETPLSIDFKWPGGPPRGVHLGTMLTLDRIVRLPEEKRACGAEHGALSVDMETMAVAQACRAARTRFLAVRVISDSIDDELPADLEKLIETQGLVRQLGAAAAAIWQRPGSIKDLWNLQETALVSGDRLARFLTGIWESLLPANAAEHADPAVNRALPAGDDPPAASA